MGPVLALTGGTLDRAAHRRADAAWLADRLGDAGSRVFTLWRDRNLVVATDEKGARPAALQGEAAARALGLADDWAFLGTDAAGHATFAVALPAVLDGEAVCGELLAGGRFQDLGRLAPVLDAADGAVLAYARALMRWHRTHRYCGTCGRPTTSGDGGHMRRCSDERCGETLFPRTDPVVIMLLTRGDACVLARQRSWMAGLYSALAGFVEPGESLEEAVHREIREEAGFTASSVRYVASQPWPFPQSLMLGFRAEVPADAELKFDAAELEDARWFRRDAFSDLRRHGIRMPYRGTIARALIEGWLSEAADDAAPSRQPEVMGRT